MKYVDEFRDAEKAKAIVARIKAEARKNRQYHFMEFCGGHTYTIFRFGIDGVLPEQIRMVHGPGCPVCVLPIGRLDMAIQLVREHNVILCSYGDMLRVPGSKRTSLLHVKAEGADIRMVYSCLHAIKIAQENPDREVVFFAIGFETTTPPTAIAIKQAEQLGLKNFSVFCNHVLTPSAIQNILESREVRELGTIPLDGFIGPGHVSAVIGSQPYEFFAEEYQKPVVIAGFELMDLLQAILMLVRQVNEGRYEVENAYPRVVTREGNVVAKQLVAEMFELRRVFEWRGLCQVPYSALRLKKNYAAFDAEQRFNMKPISSPDHRACECGAVLRGLKRPTDCKLFATACTPENPIGSCMVSSEGACAAYYKYARDLPQKT
jgi:hydrogenase expression/formation protein HypD